MEANQLKQALLRTTLELESTRLVAQEELKKLEAQSLHLAHLLQITTKERDDARSQCSSLLLHLSKAPQQNVKSSNQLEECSNVNIATPASSEEEESSRVSSLAVVEAAVSERGLPEQGKLVEAVMKAGPLLQTLLLAGPLPQWRHPPPAMQSFEIPPVTVGANCDDQKKMKREEAHHLPNLNSPESNGSKQQIGSFRA